MPTDTKKRQTGPQLLGNRYALSSTTRQGAQATVTQAFDTLSGRMVAIKRVRFGPGDERAREGFQREVAMLQGLRHPNIVEMIDVDRDPEGNWYLVLEWVPDNLEDIIVREGALTWRHFWDRFGQPILDAIVFAQKKRIAHRDIKPKNILVTEAGVPKIADYGIAKLLDRAGAWAPVAGQTFRFDHTPGYTPSKPDQPEYSLSRDCYAFSAVAISCVTGRLLRDEKDLTAALLEAVLPARIRPILERCLSGDASRRLPLASVLEADIERAQDEEARASVPMLLCHLVLSQRVLAKLERQLELEGRVPVEQFILDELGEASALLLSDNFQVGGEVAADLVGVTWRFQVGFEGRWRESLELINASEIGASLAASLRDRSFGRALSFTFERPKNPERVGEQLSLFVAEAADFQRERAEEREALASQRIFRVWRSYLRDRADLEAKRRNAIKYVDRRAAEDRMVFTTEIAQSDDIIGQERAVQHAAGQLSGKVSAVVFNQISLEVTYGDPTKVPRRGDLAINTIAAQSALGHQSAALNAVFYDRAVGSDLKGIILDPKRATPVIAVEGVSPSDAEFDDEKKAILVKALGVQDILAIEGPPGTGKTKLITEIVVQWLKRNPQHRILLSSQTHIALDNVLERVAELDPSLDLIRIGRPDEPRISDASKKLLLDRRVEVWIAEVRAAAEADMKRWADEHGVDRDAVSVGMKAERLLQVLARQSEMRDYISQQEAERASIEGEGDASGDPSDQSEVDEETTQIDSDIGSCRQALKLLVAEERKLRNEMLALGAYAAELSESRDPDELAEWAKHFLADEPTIIACRDRLALLEDWQLRVGRSSDFNAAMLSSAQIIAGTCVGIAGVKGMEEVAYDLCIVDEASKATATEILIPMSRSRRWIIVGDPKQLPPFFEEFGEEIRSQFDDEEVRATLLDRLLAERDGLPADCRAALRNQYRMIQPIGELVSTCFYGGKLDSPVKSHGLKLAAAVPKAVTWYSTHKLPRRFEHPEGQTFFNTTESTAIRRLLLRLQFVAKAQKRRISVAVIAGYTAQVRVLGEMVSQGVAEWPDIDITCNTVDAFQGRQADVCIYSVVRSNTQADLGFLREPPRLNVALSRGKSALVIVGDHLFCSTARGRNPFRVVIKYIEEHADTCALEVLE
jgi:AAA domain-containing protein/protein kinase-like protein